MPDPKCEASGPKELASEACHLCGQPAAIVIDDKAWCASCLHARGSCCAESEMEDED